MRRFHFNRKQDVSGVSGTGKVCEGIQFSDGKCAVRWLTKTASTELWDSVEQAIEIHGHGGATVLEWDDEPEAVKKAETRDELFGTAVETIVLTKSEFERLETILENPAPPNAYLLRAMKRFQEKYVVKAEVSELVDVLTKAGTDAFLYISGDADNMGNQVALVESQDDEDALREISGRINAGQELFKQWIERLGGEVVEQGGDEFLGKIAHIETEKLEAFRQAYNKLVGATLTLGIGHKISQATRARLLGKLSGKDQLVTWNDSVDADLKEKLSLDSEEATKLNEAGFGLNKAEGERGGHILGHTPSGKPIYASAHHPAHQDFTALEHYHAMRAHSAKSKTLPRNSPERHHHLKQQVLHTYRMSSLDGSDPHFYIPHHYYKEFNKPQPNRPEEAKKSEVVSELIDTLEKAGGPGSKGGHISGYDKTGKPIYKKFAVPKHFSMISAQHGQEHSHEKHAALKRDLEAHGFKHHEAAGKWGYEEKNFVVAHHGTKEDHEKINALGKKHKQEAVFHRSGNKNRVDFMNGSPSHHGEGYSESHEHKDHYTHWPDGRKFQFPVHEPKKKD